MKKNLLLVSNSTLHGSGYLDHCEGNIRELLDGGIKYVLFVPYARPDGMTHDEYTNLARDRFNKMGFELKGIHEEGTPNKARKAVEQAESIFIGGGNTFVLLDALYKEGVFEPIRRRAEEGIPYIGTSAGANVAGIDIGTTNDMPVVYPESFKAFGLVPFNINPHYIDPDPKSTHKGETRETRIKEFLVFNDQPVMGLREGAMLRVHDGKLQLKGVNGARFFKKGEDPIEYKPGSSFDMFLDGTPF